jgi:hypothetical protein
MAEPPPPLPDDWAEIDLARCFAEYTSHCREALFLAASGVLLGVYCDVLFWGVWAGVSALVVVPP